DAAALDAVVDDPTDHERVGEAGRDAERDEDAAGEIQAPLGPDEPEHPADLPVRRRFGLLIRRHRTALAASGAGSSPTARSFAPTLASSRSTLQPGSIGSSHLLCQCHANAPS